MPLSEPSQSPFALRAVFVVEAVVTTSEGPGESPMTTAKFRHEQGAPTISRPLSDLVILYIGQDFEKHRLDQMRYQFLRMTHR